MKLLVDDNLPPLLARELRDCGVDAAHVSEVGLSGATDRAIWAFACEAGCAVVSKDEDYSLFLQSRPPHAPVLWVRLGNVANRELVRLVLGQIEAASAALDAGEMLIELRQVSPFNRFVAFDWTGARGARHRAIQGAEALAGDGAPRLMRPGHRWSRGEVLEVVGDIAARGERTLIGIDCSFSLPFVDAGAYFPGDAEPAGPQALWAEIDAACAGDPDLEGHAYVAARRRHFWTGAADGPQKPFARLRVAEAIHRERRMGNPASPYVLVGASQVGKAALSGMRLLHRLDGVMPIWPFDPLPAAGPCLVEIYCQTFALDGGFRGKLRTKAALDAALERLGSAPVGAELPEHFDDHVGDALVSAAGLRRVAAIADYWSPPAMTEAVRRSEGWTFGIL